MTHIVSWTRALADFDCHLIAAGRPVTTRRLRAYHVGALGDQAPAGPDTITADQITEYLAGRAWSANTRRCVRASLRVFFGWMHATGRRADNPVALLAPVRAPAGRPRPCPEHAVRRALAAADDRVRLMVALGAMAGLRRGEICAVAGSHVGYGLDGPVLTVTGKGGRVREVPITEDMATMIAEAAPNGGPCFPGQIDGHLSPAHTGKLIARALPDGWTTHTLRHRFASAAYRPHRDIRAVQELLGHASVATTQVYTAVPDDARRKAATAAFIAA